ncbi:MAG: DUF1579 domain-containing protein [Burkholderiaceae bacterium]
MDDRNGVYSGEPQPSGTLGSVETVRALGDVWLLAEGRGQMPDGTPTQTQMLLGYDPVRRTFVGTWIGSMMNHLWVYRTGSLDDGQRLLTLSAEGPAFDGTPGKMAQYRDVIEIVDADERLLHGNLQLEDGSWSRFMTTRYRRVR